MKIFFFFFIFLPTATRNRKKLPLTFFSVIALNTFFLKLLFFCSLILLLTPDKLPNYLFRKKLPLTFFSEIPRKKCSIIPLSALKFHFLQITFFPPWSREHTHTLCFTDPLCVKIALNTFFLKLLSFCSLILLLTPEKLPNYLFRQISDKN